MKPFANICKKPDTAPSLHLTHPFGHGRFEWIMGIFALLAVVLMGGQLIHTSLRSIVHPQRPLFSVATVIVLVLSILVKGYMHFYNRQFAKITDSETLKATAADCISDTAATGAVLLSTVIGHVMGWQIDGCCGAIVSGFIVIAGVKSLWEVLGRIMGQATDQSMIDDVLQIVEAYPEIAAVQNLMVHDYGFGYVVISLRIEGYRKDSEQLYNAIHEISCTLYTLFLRLYQRSARFVHLRFQTWSYPALSLHFVSASPVFATLCPEY